MSEEEGRCGSIHFMTLFNRQGKTRLAKWCPPAAHPSHPGAPHRPADGLADGSLFFFAFLMPMWVGGVSWGGVAAHAVAGRRGRGAAGGGGLRGLRDKGAGGEGSTDNRRRQEFPARCILGFPCFNTNGASPVALMRSSSSVCVQVQALLDQSQDADAARDEQSDPEPTHGDVQCARVEGHEVSRPLLACLRRCPVLSSVLRCPLAKSHSPLSSFAVAITKSCRSYLTNSASEPHWGSNRPPSLMCVPCRCRLVYKRYASLYFVACIDMDFNELITLEVRRPHNTDYTPDAMAPITSDCDVMRCPCVKRP